MWRNDEVGIVLKNAVQAYEQLRSRAQHAISEGDRRGLDLRSHRVRVRDEAGNTLFEGTFAEAAILQFGSDAPGVGHKEPAPKASKSRRSQSSDAARAPSSQGLDAQLTEIDAQHLQVSRHHLHAIAQATSDVVYRMSADWSEMSTLTGNGFIADTSNPRTSWLDLYIPTSDQAAVLASIEAAIRSKSVFSLEHRVIRVDGSVGWTRSCAVPVLRPDGSIGEWIGSADDITDRRIAGANQGGQPRTVPLWNATRVSCEDIVRGALAEWTNKQTNGLATLDNDDTRNELAMFIAQRLAQARLATTNEDEPD